MSCHGGHLCTNRVYNTTFLWLGSPGWFELSHTPLPINRCYKYISLLLPSSWLQKHTPAVLPSWTSYLFLSIMFQHRVTPTPPTLQRGGGWGRGAIMLWPHYLTGGHDYIIHDLQLTNCSAEKEFYFKFHFKSTGSLGPTFLLLCDAMQLSFHGHLISDHHGDQWSPWWQWWPMTCPTSR